MQLPTLQWCGEEYTDDAANKRQWKEEYHMMDVRIIRFKGREKQEEAQTLPNYSKI